MKNLPETTPTDYPELTSQDNDAFGTEGDCPCPECETDAFGRCPAHAMPTLRHEGERCGGLDGCGVCRQDYEDWCRRVDSAAEMDEGTAF